MDRPHRPLHWAILLHVPNAPSIEALRRGAESARRAFPSSNARLAGRIWEPIQGMAIPEEIRCDSSSLRSEIHRIADGAMPIQSDAPLHQYLLTVAGGESILLTRVHHAAADLVGATNWLQHQL